MTAAPAAVRPPAPPQTPGEALGLLAARRATGALCGPLGSLHLVDGQVAHADSPRAPGLAELLTGCGRITPGQWAELLRLHGPRARVGEALVERRLLTRGELELGHLGTLFDAAFFVLADRTGGVWRFEPDARHWLGPVATVDPGRLRREVERRGRLLERIWPWPQLDTAPVRPVVPVPRPSNRPPGRRRRELLDHADGRRTPADLARLLGRSGFGVTADVRRLAAAGLLAAPRHAAPAVAPSAATSVAPATPVVPGAPRPATPVAEAEAPAPEASAPARPPGGLHRRVPGATLTGATPSGPVAPTHSDHPPTTATAHPLAVPDPDIALLTRVRTLLEARL
ncbi:transcriptional regulator [Kitasatospora sp. NPDC088160]|uniref:transcriptional regulator n=1 Tax=Kitasatospora sp. NPDC088160 TaxID=3364072 RepID=UPI00381ECE12